MSSKAGNNDSKDTSPPALGPSADERTTLSLAQAHEPGQLLEELRRVGPDRSQRLMPYHHLRTNDMARYEMRDSKPMTIVLKVGPPPKITSNFATVLGA